MQPHRSFPLAENDLPQQKPRPRPTPGQEELLNMFSKHDLESTESRASRNKAKQQPPSRTPVSEKPMPERLFKLGEFTNALKQLDRNIGKSRPRLARCGVGSRVEPIKLIVTGGYLAMTAFRSRLETGEIDYFVATEDGTIKKTLENAIMTVGQQLKFPQGWATSERIAGLRKPEVVKLSLDQKEQANSDDGRRLPRMKRSAMKPLFKGTFLHVHAVDIEWFLASKLNMLKMDIYKEERAQDAASKKVVKDRLVTDAADAAEAVHWLNIDNGRSMTRHHAVVVAKQNMATRDIPDKALNLIIEQHNAKYETDGLVSQRGPDEPKDSSVKFLEKGHTARKPKQEQPARSAGERTTSARSNSPARGQSTRC